MYQKCVCFIFLVILAVISCSGFHIDSLAMADFSKKNFHTSTNSHSNTDTKYVDSVQQRPHKIRHHRLWRTQAHNRYPKPHIDAFVYPPPPNFSSKPTPATQETRFPPSNTRYAESNSSEISYSRFSEATLPLSEVIINPNSETWRLSARLSASDPKIESYPPPSEAKWPFSEASRARFGQNWPLRLRTDTSSFRTTSGEVDSRVAEFNASLISPTTFPNENLAQIPPTDFAPVKFVVSRAQRSSDHRQGPRKNRWTLQQSDDIFTKAYKAKFVVLAEVEMKGYVNGSCQCYVKVIKDYKGNAAKSFGLVNKYLRHMLTARCDLVKEMKNSRKYVLLLNEYLQLLDAPKPNKEIRLTMRKRISRVCKSGFVPTKPHIVELKEVSPKSRRKIERRNRILMCTVRGFPLPRITWRRKNEVLHHSRSYNVLYKRRQSKLVIKKPDAEYLGQYECVAESLNGLTTSKNFTLLPPQPNKDCDEGYKHAFCQNGGTCFYEASMGVYGCVCPDNYSGEKCELKKPSNTRFLMMQTPKKNVEKRKRKKKEWY